MSAFDYDPPTGPLEVVHIDDWFVIINKPAGLLSVPGKGAQLADCLMSRALVQFPGARLVHRLDRDTSGLIVVARSHPAQVALSKLFAERDMQKTYIALVAGNPADDSGHIDLPIIVDWPNRPRQMICHETGRPAQTDWQVLKRGEDRALVALRPRTGRSHQLRLHMQQLGHPILGDTLYATPEQIALSPRLCLHAEALAFQHPGHGGAVEYRAEAAFGLP